MRTAAQPAKPTERKLVTLAEWKKDPTASVVAGSQLRKEIADALQKAEGGRPMRMCISDGSVDRSDDTLAVNGWKNESYLKNPIVLYGHNAYALPIGKTNRLYVENDKLIAEPEFCDKDTNAFAYAVAQMLEKGFLRSASVGFRPLKYIINEERGGDSWWPACDFIEMELLEWSVVPIPCNPNAVLEAKAAGVEMDGYVVGLEEMLANVRGKGFWLAAGAMQERESQLAGRIEKTLLAAMPQVLRSFAPVAKAAGACSCKGCTVKDCGCKPDMPAAEPAKAFVPDVATITAAARAALK